MRASSRPFLLLVAASAAIAPASVSGSPTIFSLPEPTPTPTAAPDVEGPADDAGLVPVQPRVITDESSNPVAENQPAAGTDDPAPDASPSTSQPVVQPLPSSTQPPASANPPAQPSITASRPARTSSPGTAPAAAQAPTDTSPADSDPAGAASEIGEPADASAVPGLGESFSADVDALGNEASSDDLAGIPAWIWWLIGALALAALTLAYLLFSRRRPASVQEIEKPVVAGPSPLASIEEAKLALTLDIVSATRSMMMLTIDYRLNVANRSERAIRDLAVSPELTTARRDQPAIPGPSQQQGARSTKKIARIGPHQSEAISGTVQLPVAEIRPIMQGRKPLYVPLLHFELALEQLAPISHSFVIGLPSETSTTRLHPISLDVPPGGLPPLLARKLETGAA